MNDIGVNSVSPALVAGCGVQSGQLRGADQTTSGAAQSQLDCHDQAQLSDAAKAPEEHRGVGQKIKRAVAKGSELVKQIEKNPIGFVKDHKLPVIAGAIGTVAAGAVVGSLLNDDQLDAATSIASDLAKGTTASKASAYADIAEFLGTAATAGVFIGAAGHVVIGVTKVVKGIANIAKGLKKKDSLKVAKGMRTTIAGVRKGLTGAVIGTLNAEGGAGAIATFTKKVLMPPFRKAAAVVNIAVGAKILVDGIKNKDKKKIVQGALDLGYGVALTAAVLGGGLPATIACKTLLTTKMVRSWKLKIDVYKSEESKKNAPQPPEAVPGKEDQKPTEAANAPVKVADGTSKSAESQSSLAHSHG